MKKIPMKTKPSNEGKLKNLEIKSSELHHYESCSAVNVQRYSLNWKHTGSNDIQMQAKHKKFTIDFVISAHSHA